MVGRHDAMHSILSIIIATHDHHPSIIIIIILITFLEHSSTKIDADGTMVIVDEQGLGTNHVAITTLATTRTTSTWRLVILIFDFF